MDLPGELQVVEQFGNRLVAGDRGVKMFGAGDLVDHVHIVPAFHLPHDSGKVGVIKTEVTILPGHHGFYIDIFIQLNQPIIMKVLKGLLLGIVAVVILLIIVSFFLPRYDGYFNSISKLVTIGLGSASMVYSPDEKPSALSSKVISF